MGRKLDTPVDHPDLGYQCIDGIRFEIPHLWNGSDMAIVKASVYVTYTITNYDVNGNFHSRQGPYTVPFGEWNASFIAEANSIYQTVEAHATSQGYILGSGTTESI